MTAKKKELAEEKEIFPAGDDGMDRSQKITMHKIKHGALCEYYEILRLKSQEIHICVLTGSVTRILCKDIFTLEVLCSKTLCIMHLSLLCKWSFISSIK